MVMGGARFPGVLKQLGDGVDAHIRDAGRGPHGRLLAEHRQNGSSLCEGELVHANKFAGSTPYIRHFFISTTSALFASGPVICLVGPSGRHNWDFPA